MGIHTLTFEDGSVFEVEGARNASEEERNVMVFQNVV